MTPSPWWSGKRLAVAFFGATLCLGAAATAAQSNDIVVGTTAVLSGTNARTGQEQLQGLQLWVADVNRRGGLLGRPVQLKHYDDSGEFETAAGLFEKLISEDGVDLLLGPNGAETAPAAAAVAERHGIPLLVTGVTAAELWARGYKNLFGLATPSGALMDDALDFIKRKGLRRVALVYQATPFGRDVAEGVRARARALGLHVMFDEPYDQELADFTKTVEQLKRRRPDAILAASHLPDALALLRQAKEQRLHANVVAFAAGASQPEFANNLGPDANGTLGATQWEPTLKLPGAGEFARRFKAEHGYDPSHVAATGYAAGQVLEAAVRTAGALQPAALRKALAQLDTTTLIGRYRVDPAGRQIGKPAYMVQWIDGQRVPVLPPETALADVAYPFKSWARR